MGGARVGGARVGGAVAQLPLAARAAAKRRSHRQERRSHRQQHVELGWSLGQRRRPVQAAHLPLLDALTGLASAAVHGLGRRFLCQNKLNDLPRNSSSIRFRNRCKLTGRTRGVYRKFGLCRICFRELALQGEIPGVTKASW